MRKFFALLLLVSFPSLAYGHFTAATELSSFSPNHHDPAIQRCYEQAMAATWKGRALCVQKGEGDYWVCPASKELRSKALQQCRSEAKNAQDRLDMLYLLGLLHLDFRMQAENRTCPQFYRYQEGSGICVYTNDHFDQLIREFPKSESANMAAFLRAQEAYRYYECEGMLYCMIGNEITGWIDFLKARPGSHLADYATETIIKAFGRLDRLADPGLDLSREDPDELLNDIERLNAISAKLSPGNRETLRSSLKRAKPVLLKLKETQAAKRFQGGGL